MAHLQSPKTGPAAPPHEVPSPRSVGPAHNGAGGAGAQHRSGGHGHSHSGGGGGGGGGHNHSHAHSHHHGHSHSHGGKNTGDPALIGKTRFVPMAFIVLSALLTYWACWPTATQWHEPIDHGAAFAQWLYASHGAYRGSASVASVVPRGPEWLDLPLFGGATASHDLAALPAIEAVPVNATTGAPLRLPAVLHTPSVAQLSTRLARNTQVLLYGDGAGARDVASAYVAGTRQNYSVALWFTHASSVNALWRQYAQLSQRIGLRSISLKPEKLVPNVLSWVYRFVPQTLIVLDRFDEPSIFVSAEAAAADANGSSSSGPGNGTAQALGSLTSTALDAMWLPRRGHSIVLATRHAKGFKSKLHLNALSLTAAVRFLRAAPGQTVPTPSFTAFDGPTIAANDLEAAGAFPAHAQLATWCAGRVSCLQLVRVLLHHPSFGPQPAGDSRSEALAAAVKRAVAAIDPALPPAAPATSDKVQTRLMAVTSSALLAMVVKPLQQTGGGAWQLLRVLSVLDSGDAIPRSLLDAVLARGSGGSGGGSGALAGALDQLEALALVQFTASDVFVSATVQSAVRAHMTASEVVAVAVQSLEVLNRTFVYSPTRDDTWIAASSYASHIVALSGHAPADAVTLVSSMVAVSSVCTAAAAFLHDVLGESALALRLYQRSAAYVVNVDDGHSEAHGRALSGAGVVYTALGQHSKAIESLIGARDIATEVFGETSDRAATELIHLSHAHAGAGDNAKAKELLELAVAVHRRLYGERHEVADDYALLAGLATARRDHNEALKLLTRALEITTRAPASAGVVAVALTGSSPGSTHEAEQLLVASRYAAIGDVWFALNRHVDAINFYTRSLDVYKSVYDSLHPALAAAQERLGVLFQGMGRWQQARANFKKALDIYQQAAGDVHPDLLALIGQLGTAINAMGQSDVALSYYNHCWNVALALHGEAHPTTADWKQKTMDLYGVVQKKNAEYEARRRREAAAAEEKERAARKQQHQQKGDL